MVPGAASARLDASTSRAMQDVARAVEERVGMRPGRQAANLVVNRGRRPRPVDEPVGLGQLGRVASPATSSCGVSRHRCRRRCDRASRRAARRRDRASVALDARRRVVGADRHARRCASIGPASSALTTRMMVTPVSAIAVDHRAMDGRGAAVARQQRGVHVDQAEARRRQQPVRQDLAVGGDHAEVGAERRELRLRMARAPASSGCSTGRPRRRGQRLDRAVGDLLPAAARPIGLRDDADDLVRRSRQSCSSVGTAKPACRRTRRAARITRSPLAGFRQLLDLPQDQIARDAAQPIDEQARRPGDPSRAAARAPAGPCLRPCARSPCRSRPLTTTRLGRATVAVNPAR